MSSIGSAIIGAVLISVVALLFAFTNNHRGD